MARLIDTGDLSPDLLQRALEMLKRCDIANVRLSSFQANRRDGAGDAVRADVKVEIGYVAAEGLFANKFDWNVGLVDENEALVADMSATFIVEYRVAEDFIPDQEAAGHISGTTGYLAAYPYAREFFESTTARLQLDPLVFGLLRLSDMNPRSVASVTSDRPSDPVAQAVSSRDVEQERTPTGQSF